MSLWETCTGRRATDLDIRCGYDSHASVLEPGRGNAVDVDSAGQRPFNEASVVLARVHGGGHGRGLWVVGCRL